MQTGGLVFCEAGSQVSQPSGAPSVRDDNAGACNSGERLTSENVARSKSGCAGTTMGARPVRPVHLSTEKSDDILAAKTEGRFDTKQLEREDHEFFETVEPSLKQDKEYVKEHLGAWSDRRCARGGYSNDATGRYTYHGEPVNNGGYVEGRLRDAEKERLEFGPGEA